MNSAQVKKPKERIDVRYLSSLGIQSYGNSNNYPETIQKLLLNSSTGSSCYDRYLRFIEGGGLSDDYLAEFVCNREGETVADITHLIATDLAMFHGFALHVNYNMMGNITEIQHIHFECLRMEEENESGKVEHIYYHPDWTGKKTRKGKKINVDKSNIIVFNIFNPTPFSVLKEIDDAGGIDSYNGQILYYSMDGRFRYPRAKFDKVVTELSTDEGLSNVKLRNVRNNFLAGGMLVHKRSAAVEIDPQTGQAVAVEDDDAFTRNFDIFQGDVNACAIMDVTLNAGEDSPEFKSLEATNFDKKFEVTDNSTTERIYAAFEQEPFYCIRIGRVGFGGDVVNDAFSYYNSITSKERAEISRVLKKVFERWSTRNFSEGDKICPSGDYSIKAITFIDNNKTDNI